MRSQQYMQGYLAGLKDAIQWAHEEAARMVEQKPRDTLNSFAFQLGGELRTARERMHEAQGQTGEPPAED